MSDSPADDADNASFDHQRLRLCVDDDRLEVRIRGQQTHLGPFALEGLYRTAEDRDQIEAAGADELIIWIMARELDGILDELKRLAEELLDVRGDERTPDDDD